jgi:hypothetical protein
MVIVRLADVDQVRAYESRRPVVEPAYRLSVLTKAPLTKFLAEPQVNPNELQPRIADP